MASEDNKSDIEAAEERGRVAQAINAKFDEHSRELTYLKGAQQAVRKETAALREELRSTISKFDAHLAVSSAIQEQLEKQKENQLSKKTYVLGLMGSVIALGMLLIASVSLIHGGAG